MFYIDAIILLEIVFQLRYIIYMYDVSESFHFSCMNSYNLDISNNMSHCNMRLPRTHIHVNG